MIITTKILKFQEEEFIQYLKDEAKSPRTIRSYASDMHMFFNWINNNYPYTTDITRDHILKYKDHMTSIGNSAKTYNRKIASLIKYNEYLIEKKIQTNIFVIKKDGIKIQNQNISPTKVSFEQVNKFLNKIKEKESIRNYIIVLLMANTGIRISECLDIKLDDIDLIKGELIIKDGKGNKQRQIHLNDQVIDILKEYLKIRESTSKYAEESIYLFVSKHGEKLCARPIQSMFNKYSKTITPHDLRHNFASYIAENGDKLGFTLIELSQMLGHGSILTTQKYTHPRKEEIKKKMKNVCIGV